MKKKIKRQVHLTPVRVIVLSLLVIILIIGTWIYRFNDISSSINIFNTNVEENTKFVGILNNKFYKLENDIFSANEENGEVFSIKVLDVKNIVYDKYIYIAEGSGRIRMLDRNNGKEIKRINIDDKIENIEKKDDNIIVYSKDKIILLNYKLEEIFRRNELNNPVKYDFTNSKESFIEMDLNNGIISSIFTVKNNDNTQFSISSKNEVFIFTKIIGESTIMVSNSYIYIINGNSITKKILLENISAIDYAYDKLAIVDNKSLVLYNNELDEIERKSIGYDASKISIRKNSIVILNEDKLTLYENGNIIDADVQGLLGWYENKNNFYTVFTNRIEKVNAY